MEKIWLKNYPEGVPHEVDVTAYSSVVDIFDSSCKQFSDLPAFTNMGTTLSYADLHRLTKNFAAFLQQHLGCKQGDRVAIMLPNVLQNPIAIFAVLHAGLTVVNTNPLYTSRELKHQLVDSGATVIIVLENFAHVLQEIISDTEIKQVITTRLGDLLSFPKSLVVNSVVKYIKKMVPNFSLPGSISLNQAMNIGENCALKPVNIAHKDIAFLQYTGGTTGVAKGAVLNHGNMVANVQQASAWIDKDVEKGKEIIITALPLYHIFSLTANCLTFMKFGALNVLITNPRDMKGFVKELTGLKFSVITGVNTLFNGLLNTKGFAALDFSALKITLGGGMAVQHSVAEHWYKVTGNVLLEAYGLTETSPAVCINPMNLSEYNGAIGFPLPSTEISMRDDDGNEVAIGDSGELCVRGPQVMSAYWHQPVETAKVLTEDGWLRTGDIAQLDEAGLVRLVDRKKDMILVSGFNVYPTEIEDVVAEHPGVLEVGAVGFADETSGEVVKIVVVKKDPELTAETLMAHCRKNLTGYKVPKIIAFTNELPKTNVGKILRRALRD